MAGKTQKKYTVADVYKEADKILRDELQSMKKAPLSESDEIKMKALSKLLSNMVLKEMKIV